MDIEALSNRIISFYEKISSWEQSVVKGSGLSTAQMHALEIIGHSPKMRMKELAEKMGITTGTLTVTVDRLERMGLLKRVPHLQDRRSFFIELTDDGEVHFERHHQFHIGFTRELMAGLTEEEAVMFDSLLSKISPQF